MKSVKKLVTKYFNWQVAVILLIIILASTFFVYNRETNLKEKLSKVEKQLTDLKNEDQYKKNKKLEDTIKKIEQTYKKAVRTSLEWYGAR